ncbi:MAG TPA: PilW family protein [Gammaproteobacteria bacterium]|nr:PilW family protein [Gammaproteobacteria bacterium]
MSLPLQSYSRQRGLSLVEIMVALVLGLVLLAGVYKVYIGSKQTYRVTDNQARLQENGRFAIHFLNRDIRDAGYQGCTNLNNLQPNIIVRNPPASLVFGADKVINGYDSGAWPGDFPSQPANLVAGNSVILVRQASPSSATLTGNLDPANSNMQVDKNAEGWKQNDYIFVTDCQNADIFQATSVSNSNSGSTVTMAYGKSGNYTNRLSKVYQKNAQVMAYHSRMFYIGTDPSGTSTSLYEVLDNGNPRELVGNVAAMKAEYGLDTDGDRAANQYADAATIDAISPTSNGWPRVVSVRVHLLLNTPDDRVVAQKQTYTFDGSKTTATDKRLYAVFNDTITLRNRTP